jgi:hypothetical protein
VTNESSKGPAIEAKERKAARYAQEQERFVVSSLRATMQADHGDRVIEFGGGHWSCTCPFFSEHRTCSHVMALEKILLRDARLRLTERLPSGEGGAA